MSRDTRLDRLLVDFAEKAQRLDKCSDGELFLAGRAYDAARRAIEERDLRQRRELVLADKMAMAVEGALRDYQNTALADAHGDYCMVRFALPAASLSVSPVPPDCAKCGHPRSEHHVGQGWCLHGDLAEDATVYEPRIAEELAKQLAPAAVSPVPEPSGWDEDFWITRKACEEAGGCFVSSGELTLTQIAEAKAGCFGDGWIVDRDGFGWVRFNDRSSAPPAVPEPSEPPPTCGAEANIGLRNHVCGLPTGHDGEHQCAGVLSCNTTWSSGDTPK